MNVIKGLCLKGVVPTKTAAMYYKTEPFFMNIENYRHTNNWEILKAVEILCEMGYSVDVIDRGCKDWSPDREYDLFIGLGVGNSGDQFVKYSKSSKAKKRVLLAQGPQPDTSNEKVLYRYKTFENRTGQYAPPMRTVEKVCGESFEEIIKNTDFIMCIGEKNTESHNSFLKYKKPVLSYYPAISNRVQFKKKWNQSRNRNEFLCFAGNGLICKGVDVVVEAFLKNSDKKLHICGPPEQSFMEQYEDKIKRSSNITYHGFIEPGGALFNNLASRCSYVVFHSAAEGCCTSVATAMKAGLVPVVNPWTGIIVKDMHDGLSMSDEKDLVSEIEEKIKIASKINDEDYKLLVKNSLEHAKPFSQQGYLKSYRSCIEEIEKQ